MLHVHLCGFQITHKVKECIICHALTATIILTTVKISPKNTPQKILPKKLIKVIKV